MFTVSLDGHIIYNPAASSTSLKLLKAELELEDNTAGSFSVQFPSDNPAITYLDQYTSTITIYEDGNWLWAGRSVQNQSVDVFGQVSVTFEGALAFLNDTIQESYKYENYTIQSFITAMLNIHNSKVPNERKIYPGTINVNDGNKDRYTEYESTLECLNYLVEDNGGHLYISFDSNKYYLNYVTDYNDVNKQYINFGINILDFNRSYSMKEFATVLIPLGKEGEDGEKVTIATVNSGDIHLINQTAVGRWGWIEKVAEKSDIETPAALKTWAQNELNSSVARMDLELEVSAIDLHVLDNNIQEIKIRDQVRVISAPHGVDEIMPVVKMSKDLLNPAGDKFTIGTVVNTSLTSASSQFQKQTEQKAKVQKTTVLEQAKANATELINTATTGYVTVRPDAIYISDNEDYTAATKQWKWSMGGLGYTSNGGTTFGTAITMDGSIVADYITTGILNADIIKAGTIADYGNNTSWNLSTGTFTMKKGSINLGTTSSTNPYLSDGFRFSVNNNGLVVTSNDIRLVSTTGGQTGNNDLIIGRTPQTPQDLVQRGLIFNNRQAIWYYDQSSSGGASYSGNACGFIEAIYPGEYNSNPSLYGFEIRACNGYQSGLPKRGGCLNLDCDRLTIATETSGSGAYNYYVAYNGTVNTGSQTLRFVHGLLVNVT